MKEEEEKEEGNNPALAQGIRESHGKFSVWTVKSREFWWLETS